MHSISHSHDARRIVMIVLIGVLIASVGLLWPRPALQQTQLPRIQKNDIVYLGSFNVLRRDQQREPLTYGGHALGYNPQDNTLVVGCHDHFQKLAKISIPTPSKTNPPTAQILHGCTDITEGKLSSIGGSNNKLGGHLFYNEKLITTAYRYYDGGGNQTLSHGVSGPDLATVGDFSGFFRLDAPGSTPRSVAGYMGLIPQEWRSLFGGPALTGQGALSIVSNSSDGPGLAVFDPDDVGAKDPIPGTTLLRYPISNSHPDFDAKGSELAGVAFPNGSRSVLFFGTRAQLPYCYGTPEECPGTCGSSKGPHNQFRHAIWAYDANDLLRVKNGQAQPSEIREYAVFEFDDITTSTCAEAAEGGGTFDQANGIFYFTEDFGSSRLRVHAFKITAGGSGTSTPAPSATATPAPSATATPAPSPTATPTPSPSPSPAPETIIPDAVVKQAPALSAATGNVVSVNSQAQLQQAVANLISDQTIVIQPGTYNLSQTLFLPQNISNVTIRGATNDPTDVVLNGRGMTDTSGATRFGLWADNINGITLANFTVQDTAEHSVIFNGGVESPHVYNLRLIDSGDQFVKINDGDGMSGVIIEYSEFAYSTEAPDTYTNGMSLHKVHDAVIRHNTFRNIKSSAGLTGPAILVWNGSSGTIVESNYFLNNARGVALGLIEPSSVPDHTGGTIRNNMFFRESDQGGDVALAVADSAGTTVEHNTVILNGTYPTAIEYRFTGTTATTIRGNLTDGAIQARDGATASVTENVTNATLDWFVDGPAGDLHLAATASGAIDQVTAQPSTTTDYDSDGRPNGAASDAGADEIAGAIPNATPTATPPPPPQPNRPPVIELSATQFTVQRGQPLVIPIRATDPDGDGVTLTIPNLERLLPGAIFK